MTIPIFPSAVNIEYPVRMREHWKTLISSSEGAAEQRVSKWFRSLRELEVTCNLMERSAEADVLRNFFHARKGTYEPFLFNFSYQRDWESEFVGQGNGSLRTWLLPFKSYAFLAVYNNGTEVYEGVDYDIASGLGINGCDILVFRTPPSNGNIITADAVDAYFVAYVRLLSGPFEDEYITYGRYRSTYVLVEVKQTVDPYSS